MSLVDATARQPGRSTSKGSIQTLPIEILIIILRQATEVPRAHDTSYHDPLETLHLVHPLRPAGPYTRDHSKTMEVKLTLTRVCRLWNRISTPYLYETIVIFTPRRLSLISRSLTASTQTWRELGSYLRRFDIHCRNPQLSENTLCETLQRAVNLVIFNVLDAQTSSLSWARVLTYVPRTSLRALICTPPLSSLDVHEMITTFPSLEILCVNNLRRDCSSAEIPCTGKATDLPYSSLLHTIGIRRIGSGPQPDSIPFSVETLLKNSTSLRHLSLMGRKGADLALPNVRSASMLFSIDSPLAANISARYHQLTELSVSCFYGGIGSFENLPCLERLGLYGPLRRCRKPVRQVGIFIDPTPSNKAPGSLKVVRIMEASGKGAIRGTGWLWSTHPRVYEEERNYWGGVITRCAAAGFEVQDWDGTPFEHGLTPLA